MPLLILGVALWACAHLLPSAAASTRARLVGRMGDQRYKGLFALVIFASIALIVVGWRSTPYQHIYAPPAWGAWVTEGGMLLGLWLLLGVGSPAPSNAKRFVRHPQLAGIVVWAAAHLLSNGDGRSVVLFGGLGLWAALTMVLINRRDGVWKKPGPVPLSRELRPVVVALVSYVALFVGHPYFTSVAPPRPW